MSKWSEAFNALPRETRHIGAMSQTELRIQCLKREKKRLQERHSQSLKEINAHIANLEKWLRDEGNYEGEEEK